MILLADVSFAASENSSVPINFDKFQSLVFSVYREDEEIVLFDQPIHIHLQGEPSGLDQPNLLDAVDQLFQETGIRFESVGETDISIFVVPQKRGEFFKAILGFYLEPILKSGMTMEQLETLIIPSVKEAARQSKKDSYTLGWVTEYVDNTRTANYFINYPEDPSSSMRDQFYALLVQILAIPGPDHPLFKSGCAFRIEQSGQPCALGYKLSPEETLFLKSMYHPEMPKGGTRNDLINVARELLNNNHN